MKNNVLAFILMMLVLGGGVAYIVITHYLGKTPYSSKIELRAPYCLGATVVAYHYVGSDKVSVSFTNYCESEVVIKNIYAVLNGSIIVDLAKYRSLYPTFSERTLPLTIEPHKSKDIVAEFPAPPYVNVAGILVDVFFDELKNETKVFFLVPPAVSYFKYNTNADILVGAYGAIKMPPTREPPEVVTDEITLALYYRGGEGSVYVKDVYEETTCGIIKASKYYTFPLGGCIPFALDGGYSVLIVDLPRKSNCVIVTPSDLFESIHVVLEKPGVGEIVVKPVFAPIRDFIKSLGFTLSTYYEGLEVSCAWSSLIIDRPYLVKAEIRRVELPEGKANITIEMEGDLPSNHVEKVLVLSLVNGYIPIEIPLNQEVLRPRATINVTFSKELAEYVYAVIIVFEGDKGKGYSVVAIDKELVDKYFNR